jgi:nucleoside-diphosphate-sugar epimerase
MKIAIIGANGFIGTRVVEQLHLGSEHTAVPIVRRPGALARASRFELEWKIADALDAAQLKTALQGCEAVVHAAANRGRETTRMPAALCAAAAATGIRRIVWLSCASVHGLVPEPGTNEHSPLPTHAQPELNWRAAAEHAFFQQCQRHGLSGIALRPGLVYGPRSPWFATLARELREGRAWWFGDGRGIFNGIYVDNLVSAIFSALAAPAVAAGRPYLVGDEETITWREFYLATAALVGGSPRRIASITELPVEPEKTRARLRRLADSPGVRAVAPVMPKEMKRLAKFILTNTPTPFDGWAPVVPPAPAITTELALQQQCRWRFPHKRAAKALGFQSPVALTEALKRSAAWMAFAEGETPRGESTGLTRPPLPSGAQS